MTIRKFTIFTEPHIADPAWVIPVAELGENGDCVQFSDASELWNAVRQLEFNLGRESGRTEESIRVTAFLQSKGWTREQIKEMHFFKRERR